MSQTLNKGRSYSRGVRMVVFRLARPVPKIGALRAKLSSAQALTHGVT